jgi:hypothetical protein
MLVHDKPFTTNDATVFAMHRESHFEKKILLNRALRKDKVERFLSAATEAEKCRFLSTLFSLNDDLLFHAAVTERLLLFLDNNVIQDILKHKIPTEALRNERFHALIALTLLAEDYYLLDIFACVSPAVLYEACGRGVRAIKSTYQEVTNAVAELGLAVRMIGVHDFDDIQSTFQRIRIDELAIRSALDTIRETSWSRDFSPAGQLGMRIPLSLAEEECPEVSLGYFNPWYVKFILIHMIEKKMYVQNKDQIKARRLMQNPQEQPFAILKSKDDGVEGLGDIELLSSCDLTAQTSARSPSITMGITFDNNLREAISKRCAVYSQASFDGRTDKPEESSIRFVYSMQDADRRTKKANERALDYHNAFKKYLDSLKPHFQNSQQ